MSIDSFITIAPLTNGYLVCFAGVGPGPYEQHNRCDPQQFFCATPQELGDAVERCAVLLRAKLPVAGPLDCSPSPIAPPVSRRIQ